MSRALTLGLVLLSTMDANVQRQDVRIENAIERDQRAAEAQRREMQERVALMRELQQAEMAQRRAVRAPVAVQGMIVAPQWTDEQLEQWVFQPYGNASGARQQLESQLTTQISEIDRTCRLTYPQKKKLQLAGRGDIKRFFDRFEGVKQKAQQTRHDQQDLQTIWQDAGPLQTTLQAGLFHEESLLFKSLPNTLTSEQFVRYDAITRERRAARHRENIARAVDMLQRGIRLRDGQRRELVSLLTNETKPSRRSGPYELTVVLWQLGRLPENKLRPLFDGAQWEIVNQQLVRFQQLEPVLRQAGQLPSEDDGADSTDERPAP